MRFGQLMRPVILLAHQVMIPLELHRRIEFSKRVAFLSVSFKKLIIVSIDRNIKANEVKLEFDQNLSVNVLRIPRQRLVATLQFTRLVKNLQPSLVICDSTSDALILLLSKILYNYPLVVFTIAFDADLFILSPRLQIFRNSRLRILLKGVWHLIDSFIFNLSDKIFCVSPVLIKYIENFIFSGNANKIRFIPNSYSYTKNIPEEFITKASQKITNILKQFDQKQFIISFVGNLTFNKKPQIALSTLKILLNKINNIILLIIGNGPLEQQLQNYSKKLLIDHRTFFLGELSQYETIAIISQSDVIINPSESEGFSSVISEAMAVGTPVVTYAQKSIIDLCKNQNSILIYENNPKKYAILIQKILRNPSFRERIKKLSSDLIEPYIYFTNEKRLATILEELTSITLNINSGHPITLIIKILLKWVNLFLKSMNREI